MIILFPVALDSWTFFSSIFIMMISMLMMSMLHLLTFIMMIIHFVAILIITFLARLYSLFIDFPFPWWRFSEEVDPHHNVNREQNEQCYDLVYCARVCVDSILEDICGKCVGYDRSHGVKGRYETHDFANLIASHYLGQVWSGANWCYVYDWRDRDRHVVGYR